LDIHYIIIPLSFPEFSILDHVSRLNFQLSYVQNYDSIIVNKSSINENESTNVMAWKCYRCDLVFREESQVIIHKDILKHPIQQIELISG